MVGQDGAALFEPEGSRFKSVCVDGAMDNGVGELADGVALDAARSRDECEQRKNQRGLRLTDGEA